jgi:hypothetical protein
MEVRNWIIASSHPVALDIADFACPSGYFHVFVVNMSCFGLNGIHQYNRWFLWSLAGSTKFVQ